MSDIKKLIPELNKFNQKKLSKGEVTLLAYVFAMNIELAPNDKDVSARDVVRSNQLLLEHVVLTINGHAHIDSENRSELFERACEFVLWRSGVAYGRKALFRGDEKATIDDLSGLTRVVDVADLCSITDIAESANRLVKLFDDLIECSKAYLLQEKSRGIR